MIVNQWVPAAHKGDAIGDSARRVRALLRGMGHDSDLFALTIDDALKDDVRPFEDPGARTGDFTIFHYALPSPMTEAFARLSHGRILQYHNVTPAHFFAPYHAGAFRLASLGRQELATLAGRTDVALGDSAFNRAELDALGFDNTGVFPIAIDVERITSSPRRPALEQILDDGPLNFLFVGRIVPNKKIEDQIRLAEVYKRYVDENYRFIFVGRTDGMPRYYDMVRALIAEYKMPPDRFVFTGPVPDEDLATYYRIGACVHLAVRTRGILRAPARGDGRGRAGTRLQCDGHSGHPRRRWRAVLSQGSRDGRRTPWRTGLQRRAAHPRHRGPTAPTGGLRRCAYSRVADGTVGRHAHPRVHAARRTWRDIVRIGFVVQRYGAEILGGSEYHCRLIAERLAARHDVEVLTTCARDYVTWRNEYPEGNDRIKGVTVRRFPVAAPRDINAFNQYSDWIFNHPHTRDDELKWLEMQGPWSPALRDYLGKHHKAYDALIFFTYLYAPTVLGLRVDPARSILVPTAHDEPAIHLGIYKEMFRLPAAIAYNTEVERQFLKTRFEIGALVEEVVGCGVDLLPGSDGGTPIGGA